MPVASPDMLRLANALAFIATGAPTDIFDTKGRANNFLGPHALRARQAVRDAAPPKPQDYAIDFGEFPAAGLGAQGHGVAAVRTTMRRERSSIGAGPSRLVLYEFAQHAGLDDRLSVMTALNSMAVMMDAQLVFPDPWHSLGRVHGNTSADWWDEYVEVEPKVLRLGEDNCTANALEVNLTDPMLLDAVDAPTKARVMDVSQSVCLRINISFFMFADNSTMKRLLKAGWEQGVVRVTASEQVRSLVDGVRRDLRTANGQYNAIHVRRSDHGLYDCNGALNSLVTMLKLTDQYPEYHAYPWMLMSDGEPEFFDDIARMARLNNLSIVPEMKLAAVADLEDDFSRYLALECAYSSATIAINTFKFGAQMRCRASTVPTTLKAVLLC